MNLKKLIFPFLLSLIQPLAVMSKEPNSPPSNPFLADSNYSIVHGNSAQTDSTTYPGPIGSTRTLSLDEMRYHDLGMFNLLYLVSGLYKDNKRVIWTNGSQYLTKLDYDTFDIIASLRLPGEDHSDGLMHENFIKIFDSDINFKEKLKTAKQSGIPPVYGVYTMLDKDNQYILAGKGFIRVYGDSIPNDRLSSIVLKSHWQQPRDITGDFIGINMTFDGRIILATT